MKKLILVSVLALSGCATAYNKAGFWNDGGYDDVQLAPNVFKVAFSGNEFTNQERTQAMVLLRAAELTVNAGYSHFVITSGGTDIKRSYMYVPGSTTTTANVSAYGNAAYGSATSYSAPSYMSGMERPTTVITIKCQNNPDNDAYDAAFLMKSLKGKYGIGDSGK